MFDLYSVEQAEDAIVPTIVLSSTPPEQLVFRLYDVDTLRQPAHTILFDFFGRNFLQSFFLPGFPLLAPQRLRLRLSGFCSKTHSHRPATSGRLIRGRTPLLHRRDFSSTFRVLFENSLHHYQQADPFFEFEPSSPPQATSSSTFRVLFKAQHHFSHHSDFFFYFPGFVRNFTPITITTNNKWTTSSGSNTSSRPPATSSSTFCGLLANSVHHQQQGQPSIHQDGFLQHSRAVVPHHRAR